MRARTAVDGYAILFVDGDCVLCRRLSRIVLHGDAAARLRVAPLAGVTARRLLTPADRTQDEWVVLREGTRTLRAADAVVRTLQLMGGRFALLARSTLLLPRPLRAAAYRFVASRRRAWFGRVESCPLPASERRPDAVLD